MQDSPRVLVIYYSFEGATKYIAEKIAEKSGAKLLEIKPVDELKTHGFMKYVNGGRQALTKPRLELLPYELNENDYDIIIIGTPVWAFTSSSPMFNFLDQKKFIGKKIGLFCTHEGAEGSTLQDMQKQLEGNTILGGKSFSNVVKNRDDRTKDAVQFIETIIEKSKK